MSSFGLVWLLFNVPVNNFSVMLGLSNCFLGILQYFGESKMSCSRTKFISKFETLTREIKADIRKQNDLHVNNLVGDVKANPRDFSEKKIPKVFPLRKTACIQKMV